VSAPLARGGEYAVGIADMRVSSRRGDRLITYALGSCLGIAVYDPVALVGGLLHVMLPLSAINPDKALENPSMFVDTGVPHLFRACYAAGAVKERMVVKVAGGAYSGEHAQDDRFQIGQHNVVVLRRLLRKNGVRLHAQDIGGWQTSRTMLLQIDSGDVIVTIDRCEKLL
jgi:chemotaxis protein CheD